MRWLILLVSIAGAAAQDRATPQRWPLPSMPPYIQVTHPAVSTRTLSPGAQMRLIEGPGFGPLAGPNLDLRERQRIRVEIQPDASPQVFVATILDVPFEDGELLAVLPDDVPPGKAQVHLIVDGARYLRAGIDVVPAAPGLFMDNDNYGGGLAVAHHFTAEGATLNSLTNPAVPGQVVTLWATGLGVDPGQAIVELAGRPVQPEFSGRNPAIAGLDQINFRVPDDAPLGCYITVAIRVGKTLSNLAAIAIGGDPRACPHPLPLTYSDLVALDEGRTVDTAWFDVRSVLTPQERYEEVDLRFSRRDKYAMLYLAGLQLSDEQYYSCPVADDGGGSSHQNFFPDAGPPPVFSGPNGRHYLLTSNTSPLALRPPEIYSAPGSWLLSVGGGADIGPFQQTFRVPPPVRTHGSFVFDRGQDVVLTWDPSGYVPGDVMRIVIESGSAPIDCRVPAWTGRLTIPADAAAAAFPFNHAIFILMPHPASRPRFLVPRADGSLIPAVGDYEYGERATVTIK